MYFLIFLFYYSTIETLTKIINVVTIAIFLFYYSTIETPTKGRTAEPILPFLFYYSTIETMRLKVWRMVNHSSFYSIIVRLKP